LRAHVFVAIHSSRAHVRKEAEAIKGAEDTVYTETFKREMIRSRKYRTK